MSGGRACLCRLPPWPAFIQTQRGQRTPIVRRRSTLTRSSIRRLNIDIRRSAKRDSMRLRTFLTAVGFIGCATAFLCTACPAAQTPIVRRQRLMTFRTLPNVPSCISAGLDRGNPMKGPSVIFAKLSPGCIVPWHWHPFNETLMTVAGTIENQVKGGAAYTARSGDYLFLPARHPHRATCLGPNACSIFLISEGNSNAHWIDPAGREITLKAALQAAMPASTANPK